MATSTRETATNQLFDSVTERQIAIFDAWRSAADRYHRFNHSLIEGARQSTQDWSDVGRRWLNNPTDLLGVYEAAAEAVGNGQARTLALTREWVEDRLEAQRETRDSFRKGSATSARPWSGCEPTRRSSCAVGFVAPTAEKKSALPPKRRRRTGPVGQGPRPDRKRAN